jgi:hypothetical protein
MQAEGRSHQDKNRLKTDREQNSSNRRQAERRQRKSKGYTYITMVGWIDRRGKIRRKDDEFDA